MSQYPSYFPLGLAFLPSIPSYFSIDIRRKQAWWAFILRSSVLEYQIKASLVIPLPFFLLSGDMKAIVYLQLVRLKGKDLKNEHDNDLDTIVYTIL